MKRKSKSAWQDSWCGTFDNGTAALVDVETTGLSTYHDEIIELALVLFSFHRDTGKILEVMEEYTGLREPSKPISRGSFSVHGISFAQVRGKCLNHELIEDMINRAEFMIAHNANFDRAFLLSLFPTAAQKPWYCSMRCINWKEKGFVSRSLPRLLQAHKIIPQKSHRAYNDVRASLSLLSLYDCKSGEAYFSELLKNGPIITKKKA